MAGQRSMTRAFIIALVAFAAGATYLTVRGESDDSYRVRAEFSDALGLRGQYWVRVDGTKVGEIEDVEVTPRDTAIVTMKLDKAAAPLGEGARAAIRPANLLGEKYIQISRGDLSRPLADNGLIPLSKTGVAVELDDLLNTLEPGVRARLRILINETGTALTGRGAKFNALLRELPNTVDGARQVVEQLAAENEQLGRLVDRADVAIGPVHRRREDVGRLVESTRVVLNETAVRRTRLAATVRSAPAALRAITRSLDRIDVAASKLSRATPLLRRSARPLTQTLRALPRFSASLHDPLQTARKVAPRLQRLGASGGSDVRRLSPTVSSLAEFVGEIKPLVYTLGRAGGVDGVLGILDNWSKAASYKDGLSHYFDFHVSLSPTLITSAVDRLTLSSGGNKKARPKTPKLSKLPSLPALGSDGRSDATGTSRPPVVKVPDLQKPLQDTANQVNELLDYLLAP